MLANEDSIIMTTAIVGVTPNVTNCTVSIIVAESTLSLICFYHESRFFTSFFLLYIDIVFVFYEITNTSSFPQK